MQISSQKQIGIVYLQEKKSIDVFYFSINPRVEHEGVGMI